MLQGAVQKLKDAHEDYWANQVDIQRLEVGAWIYLAMDKQDAALQTIQDAVRLEDNTDKSAVTPGPLAPARELLGEMLLQLGKPKLALEQFDRAFDLMRDGRAAKIVLDVSGRS